jgi:hypothetical protein
VAGSRSSAPAPPATGGPSRGTIHPDLLGRQPVAQLVAHDLDLVGDHHLRQLDAGVGRREIDDPVGEVVARLIGSAPGQGIADLGAQLVDGRELADALGELVVELGRIRSRRSSSVTSKWARLPWSSSTR